MENQDKVYQDKVFISEYRGWDIYFNTRDESFYAHSENFDREQPKKTYSSIKKFIDEFIKDNQNFNPVEVRVHIVVQTIGTIYESSKIITLIGLRKDGTFLYQDKNGKKHQLPEYHERDYFIVNSENDFIFKELELIKLERNRIDKLIREKELEVKKVTVEDIRKQLLG